MSKEIPQQARGQAASGEGAAVARKQDFIRQIVAQDVAGGRHEAPITRFPPEPNGYLHLGHARAICLNFGLAEEYAREGARCHLRFDDTNPEKESEEFVRSIQRDVAWLGYDWGEHLYYASDYFDFFLECALSLIERGLAYVDEQSGEEMKVGRGSLTEPGKASPYRERGVEENLARFEAMRRGEVPEGQAVLRAKIDMASPNLNMRDPVLYRILHRAHHHVGEGWFIYPMYDFAHPLEDAQEHITHSLCTLEFEDHRPLYEWVIEHCPVPAKPRQIEFSRLNYTYTVLSKRKLLQLVETGAVDGWDDPRMPTLSGARRRGVPPEAIRAVCEQTGITKQVGTVDVALLEHEVRMHLNKVALRRMGVLRPLRVVLENYPEDGLEWMEVPNNPEDAGAGTREVPLRRELWIERDDFMEDPPRKYYRLSPGGAVRLRGGYIIQCTGFEKDEETGEVTLVRCEYLPGTVGQSAPEGVRCRAAIHWLSVRDALPAEVRLYDRLFGVEHPDEHPGGFLEALNPDSLEVISRAWVEPSLAELPVGETVQFERLGYFCADEAGGEGGLVFNRTITLKDSWKGGKR